MAVAIIPSTPLLVPELGGAAAAETAELRDAVLTAAAALPGRWVAVGTADRDATAPPAAAGTFAGYGADVTVTLAPGPGEPAALPLCGLIAGWVRGCAAPDTMVEVRAVAADTAPADARERGRRLRAELAAGPPTGVLLIADGCHTLTGSAPGGYDPDSVGVQAALDDALRAGDVAALAAQPEAMPSRAVWALLAGLAEPAPREVTELYRGAPYGVGYHVGVWRP
jgi:hypothetical protein